MDLLKLLVGSNKNVEACLLCFKKETNNLDIHTVFEIRNRCEVICLSLADMLKNLFPNKDFVFMKACNDCSDLICELYTLLHNRNTKILLLDCMVQQLILKTNETYDIPVTRGKLVLNVDSPKYQELNHGDFLSYDVNEYSQHTLNCVSNIYRSCDDNDVDRDVQVVKRCQYCSETFLQTDELKSHLKIHRKKRQRKRVYYYCNDCNYKTLSKTTLQAHVNKKHLNTRPHICQVCFKGFYNRSNLNEHIKTHNSQRNQVCELCGCSFIHKKSLVEHLRLHSDTRPYKCDICYKGFVTSGRRSDHIKRSHMEKTECCLICNKKYSLKKELTRHMNNVHLRGM